MITFIILVPGNHINIYRKETIMIQLSVQKAAVMRFSTREFSSRAIDKSLLRKLFENSGQAPSSMNEQPWRWIVAHKKDRDEFNKLFACLDEGNQKWAGEAPVLMVICASTTFARNGRTNNHAFYDVGQAMGHFALLLTENDLFMRQMGGFIKEKAMTALDLPEGVEPIAFAAIGYLPENSITPEKQRKNINELILKDGIK